jgi:hypothetical protein
MSHLLRVTAATACITLCTLLPFLPGRYDGLAVPLSVMAQLLGRAGLLLVPVGALWVASGYWRPLAGKQHVFATAALMASSVVWGIVSLGAFGFGGLSLGVGVFAQGFYVIFRLTPRLRAMKSATPARASPIAAYLIVVPVAVALLQWALVRPAVEFSRSRAIRNSGPLIADIERYRAARGRYPPSLLSVQKDYEPLVIGIREFQYEPHGDAYNLLFEQLTFQLDTREIVVYNPRDQQVATSHDMDLLQLTPAELEPRRGYYAVHDTRHPHWKYFWFD